jgi:hypothetical protein
LTKDAAIKSLLEKAAKKYVEGADIPKKKGLKAKQGQYIALLKQ